MRCPAIEGIETSRHSDDLPAVGELCRMRCPAIEGIETSCPTRRQRRASLVECVAPLSRGLKQEDTRLRQAF